HGYRAGRFPVAFQSCDDSLGQVGTWDADKCRANADAYAANPALIGIVGPVNSPCTEAMQPILNRAPGGPVAVVSPTNSDPALVRADPTSPGAIRSLFPTGQRGYARVYPSDDYEAAAEAVLARRAGHGSAFVLEDRNTHDATSWSLWFHRAARRTGLHVAGEAVWDPGASRFTALAHRVDASGARAIVINASIQAHLRELLRDVRAAVGRRRVTLIGTQQMNNVPRLFDNLHGAARTLLVASQGLPVDRLGASGDDFVARFARTQPRHHVANFAVYAAAATEVLLDAIARSDGTRASVARRLAHTDLADSVLGRLRLDRHGELRSNPIAFVRPVTPGGDPNDIESLDGGRTEVVIAPSARLVGPGRR
ncbi:MAG: branched-chain amino acid transport system substrate-binding protein, partial [Conexibacter sp.]|nr:branched-chain amino acid transport system substrate-binding protein [Conexibacter sp.]